MKPPGDFGYHYWVMIAVLAFVVGGLIIWAISDIGKKK
jgi:hypothetical protein